LTVDIANSRLLCFGSFS